MTNCEPPTIPLLTQVNKLIEISFISHKSEDMKKWPPPHTNNYKLTIVMKGRILFILSPAFHVINQIYSFDGNNLRRYRCPDYPGRRKLKQGPKPSEGTWWLVAGVE